MYRATTASGNNGGLVTGGIPSGQRLPFNVADYKEKRAAQLERARRIREERDCKKVGYEPQEQVQQPSRIEPQHRQPVNAIDEMPIRSAAPVIQSVQRMTVNAPIARKFSTDDPSPVGSTHSTSSNHSYGHDSTGIPGRPSDHHVPIPAPGLATSTRLVASKPGGQKVTVGESDISAAVRAGILNPEQAEQMWRYLSKEVQSPAPAPSSLAYGNASDPRARALAAAADPPIRSSAPRDPYSARSSRAAPQEYPEEEQYAAEPPPRVTERPAARNKKDWNFDTEVAFDDNLSPEPAPAQNQRRVASRPIVPAARKSNKSEWNNDLAENMPESFDDRPIHGGNSKPRGVVSNAQPTSHGFQGSATMGAAPSGDKLSLLKGRRPVQQPSPQQYSPNLTYETSPFGSTPPRAQQPPPRQQGYRAPLSQYARPEPEEDYHTGRVIEAEEEHQDRIARHSEMEVDMYESSNVPMRPCHVCGRSFREDRIAKHTTACEKAHSKQRKVFNVTQQRMEAEALKAAKEAQRQAKHEKRPEPKVKAALPKWKQQHLEFQSAMKMGRVEPGGGPPPMPVQDMRIECPHCGRRFAEDVAERHIPKCKTIVNKPRGTFRR